MNERIIRGQTPGETAAQAPQGESAQTGQSVERRFLDHYGLNEQPFGVTPDPRFLYFGSKHRQALAALNYATESNRGFLTLIAKPGMGKTSLLLQYLEGLRGRARTVFLFQTDGDSCDLMRYILADLGLDGTGKDLHQMREILTHVLMEEMQAGRHFVLVVDEAQNLDEKVLESIRLLSNFETPWMKLIQIVLAGQPQLAERMAKPSMEQLRQRISFAVGIEPLTREEVDLYVDHRLWVAGYKGSPLFSVGARTLLAECSEGIPRNINNLCFCAMSLAWATNQKTIDRDTMSDILADLNISSPIEKSRPAPISTEELRGSISQLAPPVDLTPKEAKRAVSQPILPLGITLKEPPAHSWLSKVAVVTGVLIALGWGGIQLDIGKRLAPSLHAVEDAIKSAVSPAPAPALRNSAPSDDPANISASPKPEGQLSEDKDAVEPQ